MSDCFTLKTNEKSLFFLDRSARANTIITLRRKFNFTQICMNFKVVFFADNFRECANSHVLYEEIFKLNIFTESNKTGEEHFYKWNSFLLENILL